MVKPGTVGALRKALSKFPDDAKVLLEVEDAIFDFHGRAVHSKALTDEWLGIKAEKAFLSPKKSGVRFVTLRGTKF